ncbi:tetratricopeptide repeat protein [Glycomyces sp. NPDC049804]|uniref:tetratricopeptide repeat protein n=1 Tax=Glycomyces sp. NPDC049804 TaxID=3154363 RepID=UPI00342E0F16
MRRLNPVLAVQKWLYAVSGNQCAFTDCQSPVVQLAPTGRPFVSSDVAHIIGAVENGPRGKSDLSAEDRRSVANLVLLCQTHARLVDAHKEDYPDEDLLRMKHLHESRVGNRAGTPLLSTLPSSGTCLHGRDAELALAVDWGVPSTDTTPRTRLLHIHGAPGIGKSTLAIEIANRIASSFPNGTIYVHAPGTADATFDIVTELLAAFDLSALPEPVPSRQHLSRLRSLVEGKQMLIVIDGDPAEGSIRQVLALGGVSVICTSRTRMSGLADTDVTSVELEALSRDATQALMRSIIPTGRATDSQLERLSEASSGNPLAARILAARISSRPSLDIDRYLSIVTDPARGVAPLAVGERNMFAILDEATRHLPDMHRSVMRTLGVLPNTAISLYAIATAHAGEVNEVGDDEVSTVEAILDDLFELNLVEHPAGHQYRLHGLIHRFQQYYVAALPGTVAAGMVGNAAATYAFLLKSMREAIGYLDAEMTRPAPSNIRAIADFEQHRAAATELLRLADDHELTDLVGLLFSELAPLLSHRCQWEDLTRACEVIQTAGRRSGEREWEAIAAYNLGYVASREGRFEDAVNALHQCESLSLAAEHPFLLFRTRTLYADIRLTLGHVTDAIYVLKRVLRGWNEIEALDEVRNCLRLLGVAHLRTGDARRAEQYLRNAARVGRTDTTETPNSATESFLRSLAYGRPSPDPLAESKQLTQQIERARAVGDLQEEARSQLRLAEVLQETPATQASFEAFEQSIQISRSIGDRQTELTGMFFLASAKEKHEGGHHAAGLFHDCYQLAHAIGNDAFASLSIANIASIQTDTGNIDEARTKFQLAVDIARSGGNNLVYARVIRAFAQHFLVAAEITKAIELLVEARSLLGPIVSSEDAASLCVALGFAFMRSGQLQLAAESLKEVCDAPSDAVTAESRANALRELAVVYSHIELYDRALETVSRAIDLAKTFTSADLLMKCYLAKGNIGARMQAATDSLEAYEAGFAIAKARNDLHMMTTIAVNKLTVQISADQVADAKSEVERLVEATRGLGLGELEAGLRFNLGSIFAEQGRFDLAIPQFQAALEQAEACKDRRSEAFARSNLARAFSATGDHERALQEVRAARRFFERVGMWQEAGEAFLRESGARAELGLIPEDFRIITELADPAAPPATGTLAAASTRFPPDNGCVNSIITESGVVVVNVSTEILRRLAGHHPEASIRALNAPAFDCYLCHLPIPSAGEANLILVNPPDAASVRFRLTHTRCCPSTVFEFDPEEGTPDTIRFEIECAIFGDDIPVLIIDCKGGWGASPDGPIDLLLQGLQQRGFANFLDLVNDDKAHTLDDLFDAIEPRLPGTLTRSSITLALEGEKPFAAPLRFTAKWYRLCRTQPLVVAFGRNLSGMTYDNPGPLLTAINSGSLVAARSRLSITPPSRNAKCVCESPAPRKFKHCCGRASLATT